MVDVEADGPCPGLYSMVELGAVIVEPGLSRTFYGKLRPLPNAGYMQEALDVFGVTREQAEAYDDPVEVMEKFEKWIQENSEGRPIFISDNNGYDYSFVNYYFWLCLGRNPFGHSSQNLGSLYKGMVKDCFKSFKRLRITKHDHNPVNDAIGNCEALLHMKLEMGLNIGL